MIKRRLSVCVTKLGLIHRITYLLFFGHFFLSSKQIFLTFDLLKPVMKYKNLHMKVLLTLTVYLFFSITNAFFASRQTAMPRRNFFLKPANERGFQLPKTNKTAINQPRVSVNQLVQSAASFFILLLLGIGLLRAGFRQAFVIQFYRPDLHYSYLRHCVIRI